MDLYNTIKSKLTKKSDEDESKKDGGDKSASSSSTKDPDDFSPEDMRRMRDYMRHERMAFGMGDSDDDDDDILNNMSPMKKRRMKKMMHHGDMRMMMRMMGDPFHDPWARPRSHGSSRSSHDTAEEDKSTKQANWKLPPLVEPDPTEEEQQTEGEVMEQDHGDLTTDTRLYTIVEEEGETVKHHTILKMPSEMPAPLSVPVPATASTINQDNHTFNILMADSSGSMGSYWDKLLVGWNNHIAPVLKGRTSIYTFSRDVRFIRSGTMIEVGDIDYSMTNLTGALQKMADEIYTCKEKYVKVFLVTDGDHNVTTIQPDTVLEKLIAPCSKVVDMFVLGAGNGFPVKYSISLRSRLHNGSSNLPSLFWAKSPLEMDDQLKSIAGCISSGVSLCLTLSKAGFSLPGTVPKNTFHLNEFVYFPTGPDQVKQLTLTRASHIGHISLEAKLISVPVLMNVFRQWNSILIQLYTKNESLPDNPLEFMERLFNATNKPAAAANSIRARMAKKETATNELEFHTLRNKVKAVLLTSSKFGNELELAENILSTTVSGGKYETKVQQLKGHTDKDYQDDITEFLKVVDHQKDVIMALNMTPDDSCRITMTSTLQDLQDPDLPELQNLNKFEFLKQFTISGIGVCAPMRDSVTINPWSFGVKAILGQPYTIVSQVAMENFASNTTLTGRDKEIQLKHDDVNTRFNAVVPVFPPEAAKVMEPIVKTRLYSMCTTFAILKNPHVVDFNIHFAALGVTWVRLLHEFPTVPRPEYVQRRIQSIEATADLYIRRAGHQSFWQMLKDQPSQALMTESTEQVNERTMKCESLIKPMFILHLQQRQQQLDPSTLSPIIKLMLLEYVGRCLGQYKANQNDATPFTDFFAEELSDATRRQAWANSYLADIKTQMEATSGYQLKDYYTLEKVIKAAKKEARKKIGNILKSFTDGIKIAVNTTKVLNIRNVSSAGDVSLPTLRTFVSELGLPQQTVEELFNDQSLMIYTVHALEYRSSRERLTKQMPTYEEAMKKATEFVQKENSSLIGKELQKKLAELLTTGWLEAYKAAHCDVVQPMSQQQILKEAKQRGVEVTDATFNQVYKRYRADVGLMGNACQSTACPFYLIPDRRYNQHAIVERRNHPSFPHTFHRSAYQHRNDELPVVISNLTKGTYSCSHATISKTFIDPLVDFLATLKMMYQRGITAP